MTRYMHRAEADEAELGSHHTKKGPETNCDLGAGVPQQGLNLPSRRERPGLSATARSGLESRLRPEAPCGRREAFDRRKPSTLTLLGDLQTVLGDHLH
jgi:hypothetical protein